MDLIADQMTALGKSQDCSWYVKVSDDPTIHQSWPLVLGAIMTQVYEYDLMLEMDEYLDDISDALDKLLGQGMSTLLCLVLLRPLHGLLLTCDQSMQRFT